MFNTHYDFLSHNKQRFKYHPVKKIKKIRDMFTIVMTLTRCCVANEKSSLYLGWHLQLKRHILDCIKKERRTRFSQNDIVRVLAEKINNVERKKEIYGVFF